jgi:Ulp1 family protease
MDSIRFINNKVVDYFKRFFHIFLNHKEIINENDDINLNLSEIFTQANDIKCINPNIPKQKNSYDCGIFLLEYAEIIMKNTDSIVNEITKKNENWSHIINANDIYNKRENIMKIIKDIFKDNKKIFY